MKKILILLSAGSGSRMQADRNKVFLPVAGLSVLARSLRAFAPVVDECVLVYRAEDLPLVEAELAALYPSFPVRLAPGGASRQESVRCGVSAAACNDEDILLIHDCARCLVSEPLIRRVLRAAEESGAAIPALPAVNTVKVGREGWVISTPDRSTLFEVQTPQCIRAGLLKQGLSLAARDGFAGTDDASLLEHAGIPVRLVEGERKNIKITSGEDLKIGEMYLNTAPAWRVGQGYDVHQLVENRRLVLCGVEIPYEKGLLGHSDADVALHALMDALLGAAALGDIGHLFPDTDDRYKGIDSLLLLKEVARVLAEKGWSLINADITIVAQRPKLAPYIPQMRKKVAEALSTDADRISVKATTTEHLGFEGRMEGISSQAVCLLSRVTDTSCSPAES